MKKLIVGFMVVGFLTPLLLTSCSSTHKSDSSSYEKSKSSNKARREGSGGY